MVQTGVSLLEVGTGLDDSRSDSSPVPGGRLLDGSSIRNRAVEHLEGDDNGGSWYDDFDDESGVEWKNNVTMKDNRITLYGNRSITSWHYPAWSDRREIYIRNPSGGYLSGYQVDLTIPFMQGMQPDFDDLRFTRYDDVNGTEESLPYWIESSDNGVAADIWVNVTGIHAQGDTTLFVYYGNQAVPGESDGDATFAFFDDFSGSAVNTSK